MYEEYLLNDDSITDSFSLAVGVEWWLLGDNLRQYDTIRVVVALLAATHRPLTGDSAQ